MTNMALNKLPSISISENNIFFIAVGIAAFIFFFTREERRG